jgi:hypothetical protein
MVELAPTHAELVRLWERHVDKEGRTTLNLEEYAEYRKKMAEKAKVAK